MSFRTFPNEEKRLSLNSKLLSDDYLGTRILYLLRKSKFIQLEDLVLLYISIFTRSNEIYSNDFPKILKLDYYTRKDGTVINHTNVHLDMISRYYFNVQFLESIIFYNYPIPRRNPGFAIPLVYVAWVNYPPEEIIRDLNITINEIPMSGPGDQGKSSIYRFYENTSVDYSSLYPDFEYKYPDINEDELFLPKTIRKRDKIQKIRKNVFKPVKNRYNKKSNTGKSNRNKMRISGR